MYLVKSPNHRYLRLLSQASSPAWCCWCCPICVGNANHFEFVLKLHLFIIAKALLSPFLRFGNYFVFCDARRHCRKSRTLVATSSRTSKKIEKPFQLESKLLTSRCCSPWRRSRHRLLKESRPLLLSRLDQTLDLVVLVLVLLEDCCQIWSEKHNFHEPGHQGFISVLLPTGQSVWI